MLSSGIMWQDGTCWCALLADETVQAGGGYTVTLTRRGRVEVLGSKNIAETSPSGALEELEVDRVGGLP